MPWTSPITFASGAILTGAQLNQQLRDNLLTLRNANEQYVKLYLNNNPSIPNSANTKVSWTNVDIQIGTIWSAVNPTRLTAPVTGKYAVAINIEWRNNGIGLRSCNLVRNSPALQYDLQSNGSPQGKSNLSAYVEVLLNAAAYVECNVFQSTGASHTLHGGTIDRTRIAMWLIGT